MTESFQAVRAVASPEEARLVAALRSGDEAAYMSLVEAYHGAMIRVAGTYVPSRSMAEDVVQETWLAVLEGLNGFEGRSSLKTWIFRILMNRAISQAQRERRTVPFSSLDPTTEPGEPAVDASRFLDEGHRYPGHWASPPRHWDDIPEDRLLSQETFDRVRATINGLPPGQRAVITLRDVQGWASVDVCNVLGITETNQRVLLHRARSTVRRTLERYFDEAGGNGSAGPAKPERITRPR